MLQRTKNIRLVANLEAKTITAVINNHVPELVEQRTVSVLLRSRLEQLIQQQAPRQRSFKACLALLEHCDPDSEAWNVVVAECGNRATQPFQLRKLAERQNQLKYRAISVPGQ